LRGALNTIDQSHFVRRSNPLHLQETLLITLHFGGLSLGDCFGGGVVYITVNQVAPRNDEEPTMTESCNNGNRP
jgi:hypothetical protein